MAPDMIRFRDPALPEALVPVANDAGLPRFTGIDGAIHHNLNLIFGQSDLRAFDAMYPAAYVRVMGEIEGFSMDEAVENFFSHGWSFDVRPGNLSHPLVDLLGVDYVITERAVYAPGFELVRDGIFKVYQNREAYPRAWVEGAGGEIEKDAARITDYSWDRVEMEAAGPGRLILSDTRFPGWAAEVDGRQTGTTAQYGLFRAVKIGRGKHRIIFTYRPASFRVGLWASAGCMIGMAVVLLFGTRRMTAGV
jgi:hypothetical protein